MSEHCEVKCPYCAYTIRLGSKDFKLGVPESRTCTNCNKTYVYTLSLNADVTELHQCIVNGHDFNKPVFIEHVNSDHRYYEHRYQTVCNVCDYVEEFSYFRAR